MTTPLPEALCRTCHRPPSLLCREHYVRDLAAVTAERDAGAARETRLREALTLLWSFVQRNYGDWYLKPERREHAFRVEAALKTQEKR